MASQGTPFNFQHVEHVGVDPHSSTGFKGLPDQWRVLLMSSGISKDECTKHPQEVLDVLQFHMEGPPPKLPSRQTLQRSMVKAVEINNTDPCKVIRKEKKIGEGHVMSLSVHFVYVVAAFQWIPSNTRSGIQMTLLLIHNPAPARSKRDSFYWHELILPVLRLCRAGGVVYVCTDLRTSKKASRVRARMRKLCGTYDYQTFPLQCALKVAPVSDLENIKNEIAMHAMSQHPNIVQYVETFHYGESLWVRVFFRAFVLCRELINERRFLCLSLLLFHFSTDSHGIYVRRLSD